MWAKRSLAYIRNWYVSVEITNNMQPCYMQPCDRIYYSKVYWRLNMFRAAHRSSSGALNCICSLWFIYPCGDRPLSRLSLDNGQSQHGHINQRLQIQLKLLIMSDVPLKKCWAFNKLWSNKFCHKVSSCWLFLLIHTTMHGSMNIKPVCTCN